MMASFFVVASCHDFRHQNGQVMTDIMNLFEIRARSWLV